MKRLPAMLGRKIARPACQVFINHRSIDTKRNVAGLLYDHLTKMGVRSFLDSMNMKAGDRLFDHIDKAMLGSKVGVAVFSPRYCDSYFCLHELPLLMESKKRVVPIFYDVKPSLLQVKDNGACPAKEIRRFSLALEEAKYTVGLTFDSLNGYFNLFLPLRCLNSKLLICYLKYYIYIKLICFREPDRTGRLNWPDLLVQFGPVSI